MLVTNEDLTLAKTEMAEASKKLCEIVSRFQIVAGDFEGWRKASYEIQQAEFAFQTKKLDYGVLMAKYISENPITTQ